jgi:hypothetical protein
MKKPVKLMLDPKLHQSVKSEARRRSLYLSAFYESVIRAGLRASAKKH